MRVQRLASLLVGSLGLTLLAATCRAQQPTRPTLVVFITVDQMRADYLDRFAAQYTGGLARLIRGAARFANGFQDHAITETAPGHATVLSGRFPRSTGILRNEEGVLDPQQPLVGGGGDPASPFRFRGSTLIDWMRSHDLRSRALSVSRKDRGAILPVGRAHQNVFWYAPRTGKMTTSTYYADTLPTWVRQFNRRAVPQSYAGKAWTPLLPASAYPERDDVTGEGGGHGATFPHLLQAGATLTDQFQYFPWMDAMTLDFGLRGLRELGLGKGPQTDLLAISLSTTDAIGHRFGPDSREIHDQMLRLDRYLGDFFDSLYAQVDSSRVVIALTADHGVAFMPEARLSPAQAARAHVSVNATVRAIRQRLAEGHQDRNAFTFGSGALEVDRPVLRQAGIDPDSAVNAFIVEARSTPGVARVDRVADLAEEDTVQDAIARRWVHMIPPDLPVQVVVTLEPNHLWGREIHATHGSPYDYDAHVPIVFYGPPFQPGVYDDFARVVDMAPTLAQVIGVTPTQRLDGHVLTPALRKGREAARAGAASR